MAKKWYNGIEYETDGIDYSAEAELAASQGDWELAGSYERQHNAKIDGEGLNFTKTYKYQNPYANGNAPKYQSKRDGEINNLVNQIKSQSFSYDPEKDMLYKQYQKSADRSAKLATEDTMAKYAGMTGGMPSSYAASAAAQAGLAYREKADEMIPELYKLALDKHNADRNDLYAQLDVATALENQEYSRFMDDRNYNYGFWRDKISDQQYEDKQAFDLKKWLDDEADEDEINKRNFEQLQKQNADAEKSDAYQRVLDLISLGVSPDEKLIKAAGLEGYTGQQLVNAYKQMNAPKVVPSGNEKKAELKRFTSDDYDELDEKIADGDSKDVIAYLDRFDWSKYDPESVRNYIINNFDDTDGLHNKVNNYFGKGNAVGGNNKIETTSLEQDLMSQPNEKSRKARILSWLDYGIIDDDTAIEIANKFGIDLESEYGY